MWPRIWVTTRRENRRAKIINGIEKRKEKKKKRSDRGWYWVYIILRSTSIQYANYWYTTLGHSIGTIWAITLFGLLLTEITSESHVSYSYVYFVQVYNMLRLKVIQRWTENELLVRYSSINFSDSTIFDFFFSSDSCKNSRTSVPRVLKSQWATHNSL